MRFYLWTATRNSVLSSGAVVSYTISRRGAINQDRPIDDRVYRDPPSTPLCLSPLFSLFHSCRCIAPRDLSRCSLPISPSLSFIPARAQPANLFGRRHRFHRFRTELTWATRTPSSRINPRANDRRVKANPHHRAS